MNKKPRLPGYLLHSLLSILMLTGLLPTPAQADVWGYIDSKGVAHFASEKLDERYELYFKGSTSLDTKDTLSRPSAALTPPTPEPEPPRPVAVPAQKSKLLAFFEVSPNFKAVRHHMREAAQRYNIDFELLQALIATESGFDTNAVSPKGAIGLMQLMPPTAQRMGVVGDAKTPLAIKLTDPRTNIGAGTRYLRDLLNLFPGQTELALAAYNAGEGAVQKHGNKIPPYKETQNYVLTVMQIYRQLKPPATLAKLSPSLVQAEETKLTPTEKVRVLPSPIMGRGNMVPPLTTVPALGATQ